SHSWLASRAHVRGIADSLLALARVEHFARPSLPVGGAELRFFKRLAVEPAADEHLGAREQSRRVCRTRCNQWTSRLPIILGRVGFITLGGCRLPSSAACYAHRPIGQKGGLVLCARHMQAVGGCPRPAPRVINPSSRKCRRAGTQSSRHEYE